MSKYFFPFPGETVSGNIKLRYKRFLADIVLADGAEVTAHVPNSGAMTSCWEPGARVVLTRHLTSDVGKARKLAYTLQAVEMPDGWVSVNTMNPNRAVAAAIVADCIEELCGYEFLQTEVKAASGSRFDIALFDRNYQKWENSISFKLQRSLLLPGNAKKRSQEPAIVEIKNATMRCEDGVLFPDAKTERGRKHLRHLLELREAGCRAVILFFAGRSSARWVSPAKLVDPEYADLLAAVVKAGVEALAIKIDVSPEGLTLSGSLPVVVG